MNAQVLNTAGLARDAGVARPTVQRYFAVLTDTFIGALVPAWRPRAKVKEVSHPKFYFFDCGVVRTLAGRVRDPLERDERGPLFETLVFHELRAWMANRSTGGNIFYWRTPSGTEVDFVWTRGKKAIGIEVKSAQRWRPENSYGLRELLKAGLIQKAFGVYAGEAPLREGKIWVLPFGQFVKRLYDGSIG